MQRNELNSVVEKRIDSTLLPDKRGTHLPTRHQARSFKGSSFLVTSLSSHLQANQTDAKEHYNHPLDQTCLY